MPVKLSEAKIVEQKPESIVLAVTCNGENNNGEILKSVEIAGIIQRNNSIIKTFFLGKNETKDGIATVLLKLPNQSLSDLEIVANIENEANLVKLNVNDLINKPKLKESFIRRRLKAENDIRNFNNQMRMKLEKNKEKQQEKKKIKIIKPEIIIPKFDITKIFTKIRIMLENKKDNMNLYDKQYFYYDTPFDRFLDEWEDVILAQLKKWFHF